VKLASQSFLSPQPHTLHHNKTPHSGIFAPLFSWLYELLFPQPICFVDDLRCPLFLRLGLHSTFNSRLSTFAKSFVYRSYANSPANFFIYRFYVFAPGWQGVNVPNVLRNSGNHPQQKIRDRSDEEFAVPASKKIG
jgi:hypothetical protein